MTSTRRSRFAQRRGAITVEFALCLPVLLLIFFGAYEFCRANMLRHSADNAAYEGARRGIVPGATADEVRDSAQMVLDWVGAKGATIDVQPATITEETPEVTVTVEVPISANGFVAPMFMTGSISSSFTLARELYETSTVP